MIRFIILLALCVPAVARAQPATDVRINGGFGSEILGGRNVHSGGGRLNGMLTFALGEARIRPTVGIGGTLSFGELSVKDMRALDGKVDLAMATYGPQAQVGLRWVDGGFLDNRIYASFALLRVSLDSRLMLDAVPGVGGTIGMRGAIGASWADTMYVKIKDDGSDPTASLLRWIAPTQFEVAWERGAGSNRYGIMLGWGL